MQTTYFIAAIIIECLILSILTIIKKITKRSFIIISVLTMCVCAFYVYINNSNRVELTKDSEEKSIYMAARLLESGRGNDCLVALSGIDAEKYPEYGIVQMRGAAYNIEESFDIACYYLENENDENSQTIRDSSVNEEVINRDLREEISGKCIDGLKLEQSVMEEYDAEMKIRYDNYSAFENGDDSNDDVLLNAKRLINNSEYEEAYDALKSISECNDIQLDIIISEMYVRNMEISNMAKDDEEYDYLLKEITKKQIEMDKAAIEVPNIERVHYRGLTEENKKYERTVADYQNSYDELSVERAKRALRYLEQDDKIAEADAIMYYFQIASLLYRAEEYDKAYEALNYIYAPEKNIGEGQKISANDVGDGSKMREEADLLERAYLIHCDNGESKDFHNVYSQIMNGIYLNYFSDSVDLDYEQFLLNYFKDLTSGIRIGKIDGLNYPLVKMNIFSSQNEVDVNENTIRIIDTGSDVSDLTVSKRDLNNPAICFVLDHSGSMAGENIANAKRALKQTVLSIGNSAKLALVQFDDTAEILTPLSESEYDVTGCVDGIEADGGTNIAGGLERAAETVYTYDGPRILILLSDGYDGSTKHHINDVLDMLRAEDIIVYCIGLEGCDEKYLSDIADATGGAFIAADNSNQLMEIYSEIQAYFANTYYVSYKASTSDNGKTKSVLVGLSDSHICTYKKYDSEQKTEDKKKISEKQVATLYKKVTNYEEEDDNE